MALEDELVNRDVEDPQRPRPRRFGGERRTQRHDHELDPQLSMEPVLIGVGIDNSAVTHRLISEGGSFTVNLWDSEETRPFVKFSKPAVFEDGALNGRAVHDGVTGAPIFDEAIAWMECEVRQAHDLGTHTLFIGEVVDAAILDDEKRPPR